MQQNNVTNNITSSSFAVDDESWDVGVVLPLDDSQQRAATRIITEADYDRAVMEGNFTDPITTAIYPVENPGVHHYDYLKRGPSSQCRDAWGCPHDVEGPWPQPGSAFRYLHPIDPCYSFLSSTYFCVRCEVQHNFEYLDRHPDCHKWIHWPKSLTYTTPSSVRRCRGCGHRASIFRPCHFRGCIIHNSFKMGVSTNLAVTMHDYAVELSFLFPDNERLEDIEWNIQSGRGRGASASRGRSRSRSSSKRSKTRSKSEPPKPFGPMTQRAAAAVAILAKAGQRRKRNNVRAVRRKNNGKYRVQWKAQMFKGSNLLPTSLNFDGVKTFDEMRVLEQNLPAEVREQLKNNASWQDTWNRLKNMPSDIAAAATEFKKTASGIRGFMDKITGMLNNAKSLLAEYSGIIWNLILTTVVVIASVLLVRMLGKKWGLAVAVILIGAAVGVSYRITTNMVQLIYHRMLPYLSHQERFEYYAEGEDSSEIEEALDSAGFSSPGSSIKWADIDWDSQAGGFDDFWNFICAAMSVPASIFSKSRIAYFTSAFLGIRCLSSLVSFLFELLPEVAKECVLRTFPKAADVLIFKNSGWTDIQKEIDRISPTLKNAVSARAVEDGKEVLEKCNLYIKRHLRENFIVKIQLIVTNFSKLVKNAEVQHRSVTGQAPLLVGFCGPAGTGKSKVADVLCTVLAGHYLRTPEVPTNSVFVMAKGDFPFEGYDNQRVLKYDEWMGVDMEHRVTEARDWMQYGTNATIKPNRAFGEKGEEIMVSAVVRCSNYAYPQVPSFENYEALDRRMDALFYVGLDEHFRLFVGRNIQNVSECMDVFRREATDDEKRYSKHLKFRFLDPMARSGKDKNFNASNPYNQVFCPQWATGCSGFMDAATMIRKVLSYAAIKSQRGVEEISSSASFASEMLTAHLGGQPSVVELTEIVPEEANKMYDSILWWSSLAGVVVAGCSLLGLMISHAVSSRAKKYESQYGTRERSNRLKPRQKKDEVMIEAKSQGGVDDVFHDRMKKGHVRLEKEHANGDVAFLSGFMIDCKRLIMNRHFILDEEGEIDVGGTFKMTYRFAQGEISDIQLIDRARIREFTNEYGFEDLIVFEVTTPIRGVSNSWGFLAEANRYPQRGHTVVRYGADQLVFGKFESVLTKQTYSDAFLKRGKVSNASACVYLAENGQGLCGNVVYGLLDGTLRILGIHNAAHGTRSTYVCLDRERILKGTMMTPQTLEFAAQWGVDGGEIYQPDLFTPCDVVTPKGNTAAVGKLKRPLSINTQSDLKKSPFHGLHFPVRVRPTRLSPKAVDVEEEKHLKLRKPWPKSEVDFAIEVAKMQYNIRSNAPRTRMGWHEALAPLSIDKSVGPIYQLKNKKRGDLYYFEDNEWKPTVELKDQVEKILRSLASENPCCTLINPDLKSECLKNEKVDAGKVRTFEKMDFAWLVVGRILFGNYMNHLTISQENVPSAIGINVFSKDWDVFARKQRNFGNVEKASGEDFQAWEAILLWQWFEAAGRVADDFYASRPGGDEDVEIRQNYLFSTCNCYVVIQDRIYFKQQGMNSGSCLTAGFNSICHTMLDSACFKRIYPHSLPNDYCDNVHLKVYGDDGKGIQTDLVDDFNMQTKQEIYASQDIVMTDDKKSKSEDMPEFQHSDEITFLKIKTCYSSELNAFVPYISPHTLFDQLSFIRDITPEGLVQASNSALRQAFFWGKQTQNGLPNPDWRFDRFRKAILEQVPGLEHKVVSYEALMMAYSMDHQQSVVYEIALRDGKNEEEFKCQMGNAQVVPQTTTYNISGSNNRITGPKVKNDATSSNSAAVSTGRSSAALKEDTSAKGATDKWTSRSGGQGYGCEDCEENMDQPNSQQRVVTVTTGAYIRATIDGMDDTQNLGDEAAHDTGVVPTDFMTMEPEMMIADLIQRYSYLDQFQITGGTGTLLATYDMSPWQALGWDDTVPSNANALSPFEFVTTMFRRWRGSFKWRFQVVAPLNNTGELLFVPQYGVFNASPPFETATTAQGILWKYTPDEREIYINIDPVTQTEWMIPYYNSPQNRLGTLTPAKEYSYGTMYVFISTPDVGSASAYNNPPTMLRWMAGGHDVQYEQFQPLPNILPLAPPPIPTRDVEWKAQSGTTGTIHVGDDSTNVATSMATRIVDDFDGAPTSLTSLAAKYVRIDTQTLVAGTSGVFASYNHPTDTIKAQSLYGQQASTFMRCDLLFKVTPNGSGWIGGMVLIAFNPFGDQTSSLTPQQQSQLPHALLDLSSSVGSVLRINYQHYVNFWQNLTPTMGVVQLSVLSPLQVPTATGVATSVTLTIETACDNYETFVPSAIGLTPSSLVSVEEVDEAVEVEEDVEWQMQAGLNTMTTENTELTSEGADGQAGLSVNNAVPEPLIDEAIDRHLGNLWKRVIPLGTFTITTDSNGQAEFLLPNLLAYTSTTGGFPALVASMYAAYRGDMIYDIIASLPSESSYNARGYAYQGNSSTTLGADAAVVPGLIVPSPSAPYQPFRSWTSPSLWAQSSAAYPMTEFKVPGKCRITVPFGCNYKMAAVPTYSGGDPNNMLSFQENNGTLIFATSAPTSVVNVSIYGQMGDGAKCGIFTGVPPMYLDALYNGTSWNNYPGSFFVTPP